MEQKSIKPLGNRLLVKRCKDGEQVRGGIIIPDTAKEQSQEAEVVALGSGRIESRDGGVQTIDFEVKVGDRVLISRYGGNEFKIGNEEYVLLRHDDVLGILQ